MTYRNMETFCNTTVIGDRIGSGSWITYSNGKAVEHLHYMPWGEDFVRQRSTDFHARYTFSAKEKDAETGYSYFGARYYSSDLGIWLSVDPMSDKYPSLSPYAYCADNPIQYTDPDGRMVEDVMPPDDYKIDKRGNISLLRKTDDNFDVLYNSDGSKSIRIDKGVLNNSRTNTGIGESDGKKYTFDLYDVAGDGKAQELFEFVSDNSNVEWSLTGIGAKDGEQGKNVLSTSHIENSEAGGGYLEAKGYTIRKHSHSHPYNPEPSEGDTKFAKSLNAKFPNATLNIFHKGKYIEYNESGVVPLPQPEAIIKPKNY